VCVFGGVGGEKQKQPRQAVIKIRVVMFML
jgi:hypothetical protein